MVENNNLKEKILGSVVTKNDNSNKGPYKPDVEKLKNLDKDGKLWIFCSACGSYIQLNKKGLNNISEILGEKIPDAKEYYYEINSCFICENKESQILGEFKKIL